MRERIVSRSAQIRPSGFAADVEAVVEIERGAGLFEPRADPAFVLEHQIDAFRPRQRRRRDRVGLDAARPALFLPLAVRDRLAALRDRHADHDLLANDDLRILVGATTGVPHARRQQDEQRRPRGHRPESIGPADRPSCLNMRLICSPPRRGLLTQSRTMANPTRQTCSKARPPARTEGVHARSRGDCAVGRGLAQALSRRGGGDAFARQRQRGR